MSAPERIWIAGRHEEYGNYYAEAVEAEGEHGGEGIPYVRADRLTAVEAERDALMEAVQEATEIMRRAVADADDAEAFFLAQEWLAKLEGRE